MISDLFNAINIDSPVFIISFNVRCSDIRPSSCAMLPVNIKRQDKGLNRFSVTRAVHIAVFTGEGFAGEIFPKPCIMHGPVYYGCTVLSKLHLRFISRVKHCYPVPFKKLIYLQFLFFTHILYKSFMLKAGLKSVFVRYCKIPDSKFHRNLLSFTANRNSYF